MCNGISIFHFRVEDEVARQSLVKNGRPRQPNEIATSLSNSSFHTRLRPKAACEHQGNMWKLGPNSAGELDEESFTAPLSWHAAPKTGVKSRILEAASADLEEVNSGLHNSPDLLDAVPQFLRRPVVDGV